MIVAVVPRKTVANSEVVVAFVPVAFVNVKF